MRYLPIPEKDLEILNAGLACIDVHVLQYADDTHTEAVTCEYMNNTDGTLRWLWPVGSKSAAILKFYHVGSFKAKIMYWAIRLCFLLGLTRFLRAGASVLYMSKEASAKVDKQNDWALFTGTIGRNRKMVLWSLSEGKSRFIKLPLNSVSESNLVNEYNAINDISSAGIIVPKAVLKNKALFLSDVFTKDTRRVKSINDIPATVLCGVSAGESRLLKIENAEWWGNIKQRVELLGTNERYPITLRNRLKHLVDVIDTGREVPCCRAHGDFTPWNMHVQEGKPVLIDWELSGELKPMLSDAFHFVYQDVILVKRGSFTDIRKAVSALWEREDMSAAIRTYGIDTALMEQLYLADMVSYYLQTYAEQEQWHTQVYWLMNVWNEALGYWLQPEGTESIREIVLRDMVLNLSQVPYAILKWQDDDIVTLSPYSDIDMCMERRDVVVLVSKLAKHWAVVKVKQHRSSFMNRITLLLKDNSLLHLDCIWEIKRKALVFADCKQIIASAVLNAYGVKVATPGDSFVYTALFHLLNGADLPRKYVELYEGFCMEERTRINEALVRHTDINLPLEKLFLYNRHIHKHVKERIKERKPNEGLRGRMSMLRYCRDTMKDLLPRKGFVITFSGVDGAGKSTIISQVSTHVEKQWRMPVVVLRHRPSVLPIISALRHGKRMAEEISMASLPGTGTNKSRISSYLRFAYYYADYLFGQFYVYIRYVLRGYVVIYDRFYFDFINDGKRSNLSVPEGVARRLYAFIIKPDVNYFLYAPADVILCRKKELSAERINLLTGKYRQLFESLHTARGSEYISVCNIDINNTLKLIFTNIENKRTCAI